jgi:hypothetical protein
MDFILERYVRCIGTSVFDNSIPCFERRSTALFDKMLLGLSVSIKTDLGMKETA